MKPYRSVFAASILALAAGLFVGACNDEKPNPTPTPTPTPETVTSEDALRDDMRQLWTQHVVWTRVFIIDSVAGLPDTQAATDRLLQNQVDIGNAMKPFFGEDAGNQLTALLKEHILGAAAVLAAAKAGDMAKFDAENAAWYANADQIATFLAGANPHWDEAEMQAMMHDHLDKTLAEASARLKADWDGDIVAFDAIEEQILGMADVLTDGVTAEFPDLVTHEDQRSTKEETLHLDMRQLWEEHVAWTRVFIIDNLAGLPDTPQATQRLLQNQVDIGNAIKPFYGGGAGEQLTALLKVHITGAAEVVEAAKVGDTTRFQAASVAWYANADDIATFLASANPNWPKATVLDMMNVHLDQTTQEAADRLKQDWVGDVQTYDAIEDHILHMADTLSDGIQVQFSGQLAE